jgi:hypothetical protein
MIKQIFDEQELPVNDLERIGLAKDGTIKMDEDDLKALLSGRRTDMLRLENLFSDGLHIPMLDAKLSLKRNPLGEIELMVHPIYREAEYPTYLTDTEAEKLEKGELPNIEKMIFDDEGNPKDVLIEFDRDTNEFIITDTDNVLSPDQVNGERLTAEQKERYRKGKEVQLEDATTFQFSATDKNGIRSDKLHLMLSILFDGGLTYALYKGLNALHGQKENKEKAGDFSKGYYQDLEKFKQQQDQAVRQKTESETVER